MIHRYARFFMSAKNVFSEGVLRDQTTERSLQPS
jgi:hypothetical protein